MKINDDQIIEVDGKKKSTKSNGKAVKSIKNSDSGVVASKVKNTNVRAKVKTKTGVSTSDDVVDKARIKKTFENKKKGKKVIDDDSNFKRNLIIFLICMFVGFVIYYAIGALSSDNGNYEELVKDATVSIGSYDELDFIKNGTGFVYKKDDSYGYIVTSYYTVKDGNEFHVNVGKKDVRAKLLGGDKYLNIAVLSIDKKYVSSVAKFGNSNKLNTGDSLFVSGMPNSNNKKLLITRGTFSSSQLIDVKIDKENYAIDVLKSSVLVGKGDSGAPICNSKGLVIGLVISRDNNIGATYSIPINDVKDNLYMFEKGNHINRPYLGLSVFNVSDTNLVNKYRLRDKIDTSLSDGVIVAGVKGNGSAYGSIMRGDVVTKVGNASVSNVAEFRYQLFKYDIGDKVKLTINRDSLKKIVSVTLNK